MAFSKKIWSTMRSLIKDVYFSGGRWLVKIEKKRTGGVEDILYCRVYML